jgi:hypothetical protein
MQDKDYTFYKGQLSCKECVEDDGKTRNSNNKQGSVPALRSIVWIVEDDQALDLAAG